MFKLLMVVLITVLLVSFGIANSHHVQISFVIGTAVEIRLVFLLLCAFFIGVAVPIFYRLTEELKHDKIRKEKKMRKGNYRTERDLAKR